MQMFCTWKTCKKNTSMINSQRSCVEPRRDLPMTSKDRYLQSLFRRSASKASVQIHMENQVLSQFGVIRPYLLKQHATKQNSKLELLLKNRGSHDVIMQHVSLMLHAHIHERNWDHGFNEHGHANIKGSLSLWWEVLLPCSIAAVLIPVELHIFSPSQGGT